MGEANRRCASTLRLECQHILPHNLLQAKKDFGEEHIKRKQLERSAADALVRLGYKRRQAEQVVGVAIQELPDGLNALLQKSLRIFAR